MPKDGKQPKQRRQEACELAACFVLHATEQTQAPNSWIARDGENGLFAIFAQMVPQVELMICSKVIDSYGILCYFVEVTSEGRLSSCCLADINFALFSHIQVIMPVEKGRRFRFKGKITSAEFNKVLRRACGFILYRTRRQDIAR